MHVLPIVVRQTRFALPLEQVVRVLPMLPSDRVGRTPDFVCGAVNLHGRPIMVIDLAVRLGWPPSAMSPWQPFVWVSHDGFEALLSVDQIELVREIALDSTRSAQFMDWPEPLIEHMLPCEDGLLFIGDIEQLLSREESHQCRTMLESWQPTQQAAP